MIFLVESLRKLRYWAIGGLVDVVQIDGVAIGPKGGKARLDLGN